MKLVNEKCHLIICIVFVVLWIGCSPKKTPEPNTIQSKTVEKIAVEAVKVISSEVGDTIRASATVSGINEVTVTAQGSGTIMESPVKLGQVVSREQVLVAIDSDVQKAAYDQAKVARDEAKLNFDAAQLLYDKGNSSKAEYIRAQNMLAAAEAGLLMAKSNLDHCKVKAPFNGVVSYVEKEIQRGAALAAGMSVARIVDISSLKATLYIGEQDVGKLKKGNIAFIEVPAASLTLKGNVTAVASAAAPGSGSFAVEIEFPNSKNREVKGGMSAFISIATDARSSGMIVPSRSVSLRDGRNGVWVARGSSSHFAAVTYRSIGRGHLLITDGLVDGDTLIVSGLSRLSDNSQLIVSLLPDLN